VKITVELKREQAEDLLKFLREHGQDIVRDILDGDEVRAFEAASEKLRVALREVVESE